MLFLEGIMSNGNESPDRYIFGRDANWRRGADEVTRLVVQEAFLHDQLGLLPPSIEHMDSVPKPVVLDLACGVGGWTLEMSTRYPEATVIGIDRSTSLIEYARGRARASNVNALFIQGDVLQFPLTIQEQQVREGSVDLVHARLIASFMRWDAWPSFLQECRRMLRPGGIILLYESELSHYDARRSPHMAEFTALMHGSLHASQHSFGGPSHFGVTTVLPTLVRESGFEILEKRPFLEEWSYGTHLHDSVTKDFEVAFHTARPFLLNIIPEQDYSRLINEATREMHAPNFVGAFFSLQVSARKS